MVNFFGEMRELSSNLAVVIGAFARIAMNG